MSEIRVDSITDEAGTGSPLAPNGLQVENGINATNGGLSNKSEFGVLATNRFEGIGDSTPIIEFGLNQEVLMPGQPSFRVTSNNLDTTTADPFPWDFVEHNTGNHFSTSTYRFTAPVDGVYLFTLNVFKNDSDDDAEAVIRVNGVSKSYFRDEDNSIGYGNLSGALIIKLSANDYVESGSSNLGVIHINSSTRGMHFGGHLLG